MLNHFRAALDYWVRYSDAPSVESPSPSPPNVGASALALHEGDPGGEPAEVELVDVHPAGTPSVVAHMRADVSTQWSWASSAARIPQVWDLNLDVSEPLEQVRITATVHDADLSYGSTIALAGPLPAGNHVLRSVHVPLSGRVMSGVDERRSAECSIILEDLGSGRVLARVDESIDIQPRDLLLALERRPTPFGATGTDRAEARRVGGGPHPATAAPGG